MTSEPFEFYNDENFDKSKYLHSHVTKPALLTKIYIEAHKCSVP